MHLKNILIFCGFLTLSVSAHGQIQPKNSSQCAAQFEQIEAKLLSDFELSKIGEVNRFLRFEKLKEDIFSVANLSQSLDQFLNSSAAEQNKSTFYSELMAYAGERHIDVLIKEVKLFGSAFQTLVISSETTSNSFLNQLARALSKRGVTLVFNPYDANKDKSKPTPFVAYYLPDEKTLSVSLESFFEESISSELLHELTHLGTDLIADRLNSKSLFDVNFYANGLPLLQSDPYEQYYSFDEVKAYLRQLLVIYNKNMKALDAMSSEDIQSFKKLTELFLVRISKMAKRFNQTDTGAKILNFTTHSAGGKWRELSEKEARRRVKLTSPNSFYFTSNDDPQALLVIDLYRNTAMVGYGKSMPDFLIEVPFSKAVSEELNSVNAKLRSHQGAVQLLKAQYLARIVRDTQFFFDDISKFDRHIQEQVTSSLNYLNSVESEDSDSKQKLISVHRIIQSMNYVVNMYNKRRR